MAKNNDPYSQMLEMQMLMLQSWMAWTGAAVESYARLAEHSLKLLEHPAYKRFHNIGPDGVDWTGSYGRRHTDVDVEHMR